MIKLKYLLLVVLLCSFYYNLKADCPTNTLGLCTPSVEEIIVETITEDTSSDSTGITTITTTTTDITTTTVTNQDSGNLLESGSDFVVTSKEGDMDSDWGGQGPASMPTGSSCYGLGTDKCATITGSGNTTSAMGVAGMGTTFIQTIDISDLTIDNGGNTQYTIKVDKQDSADRIYMHITGRNDNIQVFSGTDILSESGVTSGYQQYSGNFDFSGVLNTLIIEIGGRDVNLAVGPLFDDVTINVLYNVVDTIVTQQITTVEMYIALNSDVTEEIIDVVETIFELNEPIDEPDFFNFEPIEKPMDDFSFESVEAEMQEFEMEFQIEMDMNYDMSTDMPSTLSMVSTDMDMEMPMEITVASVEMDIEMEMDMPKPEPQQMEVAIETTTEDTTMDMPQTVENKPDMEMDMDTQSNESEKTETSTEDMAESESETQPKQQEKTEEAETKPEKIEQEAEETEVKPTESKSESEEVEEPKKEIKEEPKKESSAKQKAATKIVKKMGDKGRYEATNQLKTLIVMQVLGNTKSFFETNLVLQDAPGFFTDTTLPDSVITNNNIGQYLLFEGSNGLHNELVNSQY